MNVHFNDGFVNFSTSVAEYADRELDGHDQDTGRQEAVEIGMTTLREAFARLVDKLAEKQILSLREVEFVVEGYESEHLSEPR